MEITKKKWACIRLRIQKCSCLGCARKRNEIKSLEHCHDCSGDCPVFVTGGRQEKYFLFLFLKIMEKSMTVKVLKFFAQFYFIKKEPVKFVFKIRIFKLIFVPLPFNWINKCIIAAFFL